MNTTDFFHSLPPIEPALPFIFIALNNQHAILCLSTLELELLPILEGCLREKAV